MIDPTPSFSHWVLEFPQDVGFFLGIVGQGLGRDHGMAHAGDITAIAKRHDFMHIDDDFSMAWTAQLQLIMIYTTDFCWI